MKKCAEVCNACQIECDSCFQHCLDLVASGKAELRQLPNCVSTAPTNFHQSSFVSSSRRSVCVSKLLEPVAIAPRLISIGSYPSLRIASRMAVRSLGLGAWSNCTRARSVARLTLAWTTVGIFRNPFSTRRTQAAQVMPSTPTSIGLLESSMLFTAPLRQVDYLQLASL